MALTHRLKRIALATMNVLLAPIDSFRRIADFDEERRGMRLARQWPLHSTGPKAVPEHSHDQENPLRTYFEGVTEGPGVWKWVHYFDPYHRHLQKFVGQPFTLVEIGVYSGGSLDMWKRYFGSGCRIHGVDIEDACRIYDDETTTIHIGDQANRDFWRRFRQKVPAVDVLIDDGGHTPEQQMVTVEEMLAHLRPGGVYICEDIHRVNNEFAAFAHSLAKELNAMKRVPHDNGLQSEVTPFQSAIYSIHFYPYMVVIEKGDGMQSLVAPKHGSQWQPFRMADSDPEYRKSNVAAVN